jgi:amino acid transporter
MNDSTRTPTARRRVPLWVAVALSLAIVGPSLAMAGNGQAVAGTAGKAVPLVFLIGLVGVALVGYGFVRLTRRFNHAGSVYALVGVVLGPRAGFFAGFALLGAYTGFSIGLAALVSQFTNALLLELQNHHPGAFQLPWPAVATVAVLLAAFLAVRDTKFVAKVLMVIEGVGIVGMLILAAVIFGKGGAPSTGIDFSAFSFSGGVGISQVMTAVVAAFLSWAGFEACASLGEETTDPRRNIPRALAGTLALTGVLFVVIMFAQTVGFGTDAAGVKAFNSSGNTLGDLSKQYIGSAFSLVMIFAAVVSAFACLVGSAASAGRLLYAFSRDGFGPASLTRLDGRAGAPRNAIWLVFAVALVAGLLSWATGWPKLGTGIASLDAYVLFGSAGAVSLMIAYLMAEVAAIVFSVSPGFAQARQGEGSKLLGVLLPGLGFAFIAVVLWYNVKDQQHPLSSPAYLGLAWAAIGLVVAVSASAATRRMRLSLAAELMGGAEPSATMVKQDAT